MISDTLPRRAIPPDLTWTEAALRSHELFSDLGFPPLQFGTGFLIDRFKAITNVANSVDKPGPQYT
jgi:hypothetical protein